MFTEDELADANAVLQTVREGLRLVAPLVGAALVSAVLDAAMFLLAAAAIAGWPPASATSVERCRCAG